MDAQVTETTVSPTVTTPSISAIQRTLAVQELLEKILVSTDTRTLLLVQRVSRHWKETIDSSPELQVKLFFRVGSVQETKMLCLEPDSMVIDNEEYAVVNPLLFSQDEAGSFYQAAFTFCEGIQRSLSSGLLEVHSWSRMLPAQPSSACFDMFPMLSQQPTDEETCTQNMSLTPMLDIELKLSKNFWQPDAPPGTTARDRVIYANETVSPYGVDIVWDQTYIADQKMGHPVSGATMISMFEEQKRGRDLMDIRRHRFWMEGDEAGRYGSVLPYGQMVEVECGHVGLASMKQCCREAVQPHCEAEGQTQDSENPNDGSWTPPQRPLR